MPHHALPCRSCILTCDTNRSATASNNSICQSSAKIMGFKFNELRYMSRKMPERRSLAQSGLGKRCTVIAGEINPVSLTSDASDGSVIYYSFSITILLHCDCLCSLLLVAADPQLYGMLMKHLQF